MSSKLQSLWFEKYRPNNVKEYVFKNKQLEKIVYGFIEEQSFGHLILAGPPGTGKTSLAKMLINETNVEDADVLYINASKDNGVDMIRQKVTTFSQTMPWGRFKVILLDEADYMSPEGQAALRSAMEMYAESVRFILTCNYPDRLIPAMFSRSQLIHIDMLDETDFSVRVAEILVAEGVEFDLAVFDNYMKVSYPDLRKAINMVQLNTVNGKLQAPTQDDGSTNWKFEMIELFRKKQYRAARQHIIKNIRYDEYVETFKFLYQNLELFGASEDIQDQAVVIIRDGLVRHSMIADPEINLSATIVELEQLQK